LIADAFAATVAVRLVVVDSAGEAERIQKQLKNGADFAVLARERSTDATAIDGGFLGKVDPTSLRPELRDALQGLRPGELSGIVKLPSGYALLKVLADSEVARLADVDRARQAAIAAESSVKYGPDVEGWAYALAAVGQISKPDGWEQDLQAICEVHTLAYATAMDRINRLLDPADDNGLARNSQEPRSRSRQTRRPYRETGAVGREARRPRTRRAQAANGGDGTSTCVGASSRLNSS